MPFNKTLKWTFSYFLLFGSTAIFAQPCIPWSDEFYKKSDLIVGSIEINAAEIFDLSKADESKAIHKLANKLHINTQPQVIRRQLLFTQDGSFKKRALDESIRLIRSKRYIKDVEIIPYEVCGRKVNIKVHTTDKWTLAPGASFGKSGGKNKSGIEIQENNLLGLGKSLSLNYKNNEDRREKTISYSDEQFLGTRLNLRTSIQRNSDGNGYELDFSLPYYSLESHRTWGTNNAIQEQETSIYTNGEVSKTVKVETKTHSAFWGWSNGLNNDSVNRFKVGWSYNETQTNQLQPITQSYPWFEYEYIKEQYTTRTNFKSMGEIEDISLGLEFALEVGFLNKELGSSEDHIRLASKVSKGFEFENSLAFINSDFVTYLGDGRLQGETLNLKGELFTFNDKGSNLYFSGNYQVKNNLQENEQLLLGDETGLRGYPTGIQSGTKSIVLTAEKRFHYNWYPLKIAKFGAVVFADAGTTWGGENESEVLSDIGFGLRIIPTRTSKTKALHLDVAFPLSSRENIDSYQITLKTKQSF